MKCAMKNVMSKHVMGWFSALALSGAIFSAEANDAILEKMKQRAPSIVELKTKGIIGEKPDGYLGVIQAGKGGESVVAEENADRKAIYEARAAQQGHPVEVLSKVLGRKRIEQEPKGHIVFDELSGGWNKK